MDIKEITKQIQNPFMDLTFNEELHRYYVNGFALKQSVSQLVSSFSESFDTYEISLRIAERTGKTQEDIQAEWKLKRDESIVKGNMVHDFAEKYYYNRDIMPENILHQSVINFFKSIPEFVIPVAAELMMYEKSYLFAGTCDLILYNIQNNTFIPVDYKTNKDLFKNYKNKKLFMPFNKFLDNPFNKYQIQISLYQILLEQIEGVKVSNRKIIWLRDNGSFEMFDTIDLTNIIKKEIYNVN
jgi:hypothetical protein